MLWGLHEACKGGDVVSLEMEEGSCLPLRPPAPHRGLVWVTIWLQRLNPAKD